LPFTAKIKSPGYTTADQSRDAVTKVISPGAGRRRIGEGFGRRRRTPLAATGTLTKDLAAHKVLKDAKLPARPKVAATGIDAALKAAAASLPTKTRTKHHVVQSGDASLGDKILNPTKKPKNAKLTPFVEPPVTVTKAEIAKVEKTLPPIATPKAAKCRHVAQARALDARRIKAAESARHALERKVNRAVRDWVQSAWKTARALVGKIKASISRCEQKRKATDNKKTNPTPMESSLYQQQAELFVTQILDDHLSGLVQVATHSSENEATTTATSVGLVLKHSCASQANDLLSLASARWTRAMQSDKAVYADLQRKISHGWIKNSAKLKKAVRKAFSRMKSMPKLEAQGSSRFRALIRKLARLMKWARENTFKKPEMAPKDVALLGGNMDLLVVGLDEASGVVSKKLQSSLDWWSGAEAHARRKTEYHFTSEFKRFKKVTRFLYKAIRLNFEATLKKC
jgi:hypothetical protein